MRKEFGLWIIVLVEGFFFLEGEFVKESKLEREDVCWISDKS